MIASNINHETDRKLNEIFNSIKLYSFQISIALLKPLKLLEQQNFNIIHQQFKFNGTKQKKDQNKLLDNIWIAQVKENYFYLINMIISSQIQLLVKLQYCQNKLNRKINQQVSYFFVDHFIKIIKSFHPYQMGEALQMQIAKES